MKLQVSLLLALTASSWAMTVTMQEAESLPEELKPIMPGGSWFDDMAVKRLQRKHHELREMGKLEGHKHEEDPEEMFIMARLASPSIVSIPEIGSPVTLSPHSIQDIHQAMRYFRSRATHTLHGTTNHDHHEGEDNENEENERNKNKRPQIPASSSEQFLMSYERELNNFFKHFMSAMMQAEVGGVSIETRKEEEGSNDVSSE